MSSILQITFHYQFTLSNLAQLQSTPLQQQQPSQFSTTPSTPAMQLLLISSILSVASATVFLGQLGGRHVAYINGVDECAFNTDLGAVDTNPCEVNSFTVSGISGFQFSGCGSDNFILLRNGAFNSECRFNPTKIPCPQGELGQVFACS